MNPFINGNPVKSDKFFGRNKEIRRLISRINSSQSTAVIGEPRCGKTSIFIHLLENIHLDERSKGKLFICYIDVYTLSNTVSQAGFWKIALKDIYLEIIKPNPDFPLSESYHTCKNNNFQTQVLENFLKIFEKNGYQLVLMLDEVDSLIHHSVLNSAEFFGSLRSLASRISSFSMITASRQSVSKLNASTQSLNPTGSPYFNIFDELTLGPLAQTAIDQLLSLGDDLFNPQDKNFIKDIAGAHPFLLQSAASELWELYLDDESPSPEHRLEDLSQHLLETAHLMLSSTWSIWSPQTRMAMTIIALSQAPHFIDRTFNTEEIFYDIRDLGPELRNLESQGFIKKDESSTVKWCIRPKVFVLWVVEEVMRTVRDKSAFEEWLRIQEWDGILTKGEKDNLSKAGLFLVDIFKNASSQITKSVLTNQ